MPIPVGFGRVEPVYRWTPAGPTSGCSGAAAAECRTRTPSGRVSTCTSVFGSSLGPQHGLGMASRGVALSIAQHPGDFVDPILSVQYLNVAGGNASASFLGNHQMIVGPSGNLGKMGDH